MKSKERILEEVKNGRKSQTLDGRDYSRLVCFFEAEDYKHFGFKLKEGEEIPKPLPWTEEEIKKHLAFDLEFVFEKALNQRGISPFIMYKVIKMWMWVLDDPLQDFDDYAMYGLPLFKAVAVKYNLANPTGTGKEQKYDY